MTLLGQNASSVNSRGLQSWCRATEKLSHWRKVDHHGTPWQSGESENLVRVSVNDADETRETTETRSSWHSMSRTTSTIHRESSYKGPFNQHAHGRRTSSSTGRLTAELSASKRSPKEYVKNVIHIKDRVENLLQDSRCSGTHTVKKGHK